MSFTVICDKCGNKATFTNESRRWTKEIEIVVDMSGFYNEVINSIDIHCENIDCPNFIEIKC
jgi:hypothetical protein